MAELRDDYTHADHRHKHDSTPCQQHRLPPQAVNEELWRPVSVRYSAVQLRPVDVVRTIAGIVLAMKTEPVTPVASSAVVPSEKP